MTKRLRALIFPGDGTALVPLTQGKVAVIDEADAPLVSDRHWQAHKNRRGCWYAVHTGYVCLQMHRVIMDAPAGVEVDHGDGDGLNNRRANMTLCDHPANCRNMGPPRASKSGYRGVWPHPNGSYHAKIKVGPRQIHIGVYRTLDEARAARARVEASLVGIAPRRREELGLWLS